MHPISLVRLAMMLGLASAACSKDTARGSCPAGQVESNGACRCLCENSIDCTECGSGLACDADGVCVPGTGPAILSVVGNDPADSSRVVDGLVVVGTLLAQAAYELRTATQTFPLTPRSQSDNGAELILPPDIRSGNYTLVASNQAGAAQATAQLTLPELDGQTLLARINSNATGQLAIARVPVGIVAGSVGSRRSRAPLSGAGVECGVQHGGRVRARALQQR